MGSVLFILVTEAALRHWLPFYSQKLAAPCSVPCGRIATLAANIATDVANIATDVGLQVLVLLHNWYAQSNFVEKA
jgi:hypothetical protein